MNNSICRVRRKREEREWRVQRNLFVQEEAFFSAVREREKERVPGWVGVGGVIHGQVTFILHAGSISCKNHTIMDNCKLGFENAVKLSPLRKLSKVQVWFVGKGFLEESTQQARGGGSKRKGEEEE